LDRMDVAVGTLIKGLKERGQFENTLIVFMSDNGANPEQGPFGKYSGKEIWGTVDSKVYQGQSWATYSNTPFRRYKHFTHEGGISTPLIVHWPKGISKFKNGQVIQNESHIIDIMPTLVEITNATYLSELNGHVIQPMEGESLMPIFKSKSFRRTEPIYWEHEGNRAVRSGQWKIVSINHKPWEFPMEVKRKKKRIFTLTMW